MEKTKKITKHLVAGSLLALAMVLVIPSLAFAPQETFAQGLFSGQQKTFTGQTASDPVNTIGTLIQFVGGFLVVIATLLVVYAGFQWMTAMGDTKKVENAKTLLMQAVIGLIIILSASGIASWVFTQLQSQIK